MSQNHAKTEFSLERVFKLVQVGNDHQPAGSQFEGDHYQYEVYIFALVKKNIIII